MPNSESKNSGYQQIASPNLVVQQRMGGFSGRKWNLQDRASAAVMVMLHFLCLLAPFTFSWAALWVALGINVVTGLLGITLCYHRCLSHNSFKLPRWLEYFFAYCGVQALQGDPINWVSTHRFHHQLDDSERDPHSPLGGFWHSHMGWIFNSDALVQKCVVRNNVGDLEEKLFYKFIRITCPLHPAMLAFILYEIGGMPFVVWGMGVRSVYSIHVTCLVNSACHLWGKQPWKTGDLSRNNWIACIWRGLAQQPPRLQILGSPWTIEWWQIDTTWYVIKFLEAVGLATDVKLPAENQQLKMAHGRGISEQA